MILWCYCWEIFMSKSSEYEWWCYIIIVIGIFMSNKLCKSGLIFIRVDVVRFWNVNFKFHTRVSFLGMDVIRFWIWILNFILELEGGNHLMCRWANPKTNILVDSSKISVRHKGFELDDFCINLFNSNFLCWKRHQAKAYTPSFMTFMLRRVYRFCLRRKSS